MAIGKTQTPNPLKTRKKSLSYYRGKEQTPPPSFLNSQPTQTQRELKESSLSPFPRKSLRPSSDKPLVIIMSKKSIFLFFFTIALIAVLCFAAGFLVSYFYFGPKPAMTVQKQEMSATTTPLAPISSKKPHTFFSLELATSDDYETTQQMIEQLKLQKIIPFITTQKDPSGRNVYKIYAGKYSQYTNAYRALHKLPEPFSNWGKVVKLEHHDTNH